MSGPRLTLITLLACASLTLLASCGGTVNNSDAIQTAQQEQLTREATAQTGMPAIKNFRERKLLKDIYELRDQNGLTTYTYIVAEMTGKLVFIGESIGYGIPYSAQYSSPEKVVWLQTNGGTNWQMPQSEPNGIFSPASAEGTWVLLVNTKSKDGVSVVYIESRIIVSPFKLQTN